LARFLVDAYLRDLRRVGIGGRWPHSRSLMFAAAGFRRGCVGTRPRKRAVKVNGGDYRFFERHGIFRALFFALLLQGASEDLAFYSARHGCRRALLGRTAGGGRPYTAILAYQIIVKDQVFRSA